MARKIYTDSAKRIAVMILGTGLAFGAPVFAQEEGAAAPAGEPKGFTATVDISTDFLNIFSHDQDEPNKSYDQPDAKLESLYLPNFDDTAFAFTYDGGNWGGTFGLGFKDQGINFNTSSLNALELDDVTGWVKFGELAKVQLGKFTSRAVNLYNDDVDDYDLGVFTLKTSGSGISMDVYDGEPDGFNASDKFGNGLLASLFVGPATIDLLAGTAYNYGDQSPSSQTNETEWASASYGIRATIGLGEAAKIIASFRTGGYSLAGSEDYAYGDNIFGLFADITAIDKLGILIGYSGYAPAYTGDNASTNGGETLTNYWSGIDLRVAYTGLDIASIGFHANLSFAAGGDNPTAPDNSNKSTEANVFYLGEDTSWLFLYTALGATIKLSDTLSVPVYLANKLGVYSYKSGNNDASYTMDAFAIQAKLKYTLNEHASVFGGLRLDVAGLTDDNGTNESTYTDVTFSVPIGINVTW